VVPWILLERASMPGGGELRLARRGTEFSIMLGDNELMNSRLSGSEDALARISCAKIRERQKPRVLIGGLGMGFTLRAALAQLGTDAMVTVAEVAPAVVSWARGPLAGIFAGSLADQRVSIYEGDVGDLIWSDPAKYDAILLDVDNGPEGMTRRANDSLYSRAGLNAARVALTKRGVLAVWSSGPNRDFAYRLRRSGFNVEERVVRANSSGRGARHIIWIGTSGGGPQV
jgi:spermidine synthase